MDQDVSRGYLSVLRWRADVTRDEARNVAIMLLDPERRAARVRRAPISSISPRLREQGLLDNILVQLEARVQEADPPTVGELRDLSRSLQHESLCMTPPKPIAVGDLDETCRSLYRAYLQPRGGGRRGQSKRAILDRVVELLRSRHRLRVERAKYIEDFLFDAVIGDGDQPAGLEVLSFAADRKDWSPVEQEAGYFVFGLGQLEIPGYAVVQPPFEGHVNGSAKAFSRVRGFFERNEIPFGTPAQLEEAGGEAPLEEAFASRDYDPTAP